MGSDLGSQDGNHTHPVLNGKANKIYQFSRAGTPYDFPAKENAGLASDDQFDNLFMGTVVAATIPAALPPITKTSVFFMALILSFLALC
ncbi:MAG: hypothetical protein WAL98_20840 [Desulfatiglandaceae bacterium]|jgi:hypothetical protein